MVLKTDGDTLWFWTVKTSLTLFWFFCNFLVKVRRGNNGAMGSVPFYNPNMRSSLTFITYFVFFIMRNVAPGFLQVRLKILHLTGFF